MSRSSFIKQNPLAVFLGLTFGFTWILIAVILVSTPAEIDPTEMPAWLFILALLAGFGPSLAGIITVQLSEGKEGLRALLGRLKVWRVGAVWYVVALLVAPLVSVLTLALMAALGKPASLGDVASRVAIGLVWPIFSSLGEELG